MRTTLNIDELLLAQAQHILGVPTKTEAIHEALRQIVQRDAGRRLLERQGSVPDAWAPARRSRPGDPEREGA
jgi:Arc/MetJ family transcription regulator